MRLLSQINHPRRSYDYHGFVNFLGQLLSCYQRPYVSSMSLMEETITIANPSFYASIPMRGYFITDHKKNHRYNFPQEFILSPLSSVTLYCCPLKFSKDNETSNSNTLLWRNKDGSLRQAEVLLNDYDRVFLYSPQNIVISSCAQQKLGNPQSARYGGIDPTFHSLRRLLILVCRLVLIFVHGYHFNTANSVLVQGYWGSVALDSLAR